MSKQTREVDQHVGDQLSGFVDGELTHQERQMVSLHCEQCDECRNNLSELRELRERIGKSRLSEVGEDKWRENMNDPTVKNSRGVGWILIIVGILAISGVVVYEFIVDPGLSIWMKLIITAIYGGLAVLLFSVLRQRLIERKSDKYKDVEI